MGIINKMHASIHKNPLGKASAQKGWRHKNSPTAALL
jgi:hypothetical protein